MSLLKIVQNYRSLNRNVKNAIAAQFSVQSVNSAFFLLLNYYMTEVGFKDFEIAEVLSFRFLAVCIIAFPLGLFIKGRRLVPLFWVAVIGVSILSHMLIMAVSWGDIYWAKLFSSIWGVVYVCIQVAIMPYILLHAPKEQHSEAIALSYLSLGGTFFIIGTLYAVLTHQFIQVDEKITLQVVASLSLFLGVFFLVKIKGRENLSQKIPLAKIFSYYDWRLICKAIIPTILLAIGAGFTIPVINLFFYHVHGVPSDTFAALGSVTWLLVTIVMLLIPVIKRRFGYHVAITLFQSLAVLTLFGLTATEWMRPWEGAAFMAGLFYMLRQPLMSAASPMTTELTMYFVGEKNQEMIAALNASIWSGSWFVSTDIFSRLRQADWAYSSIFMFTVILYVIAIAWYAYLIRVYERSEKT